jgi:K+-transporting ATPase ATPase C chain
MKINLTFIHFINQLKSTLLLLLTFTVITGFIYPLVMTGFAQLIFPREANGSLLVDNQVIQGSELIAQNFDELKYFWGRPSATSPFLNNATASNGSNLGSTNPVLIEMIKARIEIIKQSDPNNPALIPIELLTASSSGLDPHISPIAAAYQIQRIANARNLSQKILTDLVNDYKETRQFLFLGEERVNVLKLNLALDKLQMDEKNNKKIDNRSKVHGTTP